MFHPIYFYNKQLITILTKHLKFVSTLIIKQVAYVIGVKYLVLSIFIHERYLFFILT